MENTKKILSLVFIVASLLIWFIFQTFLSNIFGYLQWLERYEWLHLAINISSILIGLLALLGFYKIKIVYDYVFEVVSEVKKVSWPNKKETWSATFVVVVAVIIAGLVLGVFDWISASLLGLILS